MYHQKKDHNKYIAGVAAATAGLVLLANHAIAEINDRIENSLIYSGKSYPSSADLNKDGKLNSQEILNFYLKKNQGDLNNASIDAGKDGVNLDKLRLESLSSLDEAGLPKPPRAVVSRNVRHPDNKWFTDVSYFQSLSDSVTHQNIRYAGNNSPTDNVGDKGNSFSGLEVGLGRELLSGRLGGISGRVGFALGMPSKESWSIPTVSYLGKEGEWKYDAEADMKQYLAGLKYRASSKNWTFETEIDAVFSQLEGKLNAEGYVDGQAVRIPGKIQPIWRGTEYSGSRIHGRGSLKLGYDWDKMGIRAGVSQEFGPEEELENEVNTNVIPPPGARITSIVPGELTTKLSNATKAFIEFVFKW
jgi:hypothetical protein